MPDAATYVWEPVESSHVAALGYSDMGHFIYHSEVNTLSNERVVRLYVAFKNGGVYDYGCVTETTFHQLRSAHSVGKALNMLYPNQQFEKVGQIDPDKLKGAK